MTVGPDCRRCGKTLDDWVGNIMVDASAYVSNSIKDLHVLCKSCTRIIDEAGHRRSYHNLWELSWVKDDPMGRLASVLRAMMREHEVEKVWENQSIKELGFIISLTLPYDDANTFLRYLNPDEWDFPGQYLKALDSKHGKGETY